jgi:hypothetical protein
MEDDEHNGPETWTVDDVKRWAEKTFPFGTNLGASLEDNDVDGAILLNHVTDVTLKVDIGIKSLGQRVKILDQIRHLKTEDCNIPVQAIANGSV